MNSHINTLNNNSSENYSVEQLSLPLELTKKIDTRDPYWSFTEVMEGVNLKKYFKPHRGNHGYNRTHMLRAVLFAYMLGHYSLRQLESDCRNDIRFMNIMNFDEPSFMAFSRLISHDLKYQISDIFTDINQVLELKAHINTRVLYVDGTKEEANANKFTFVWRKTAENTLAKTQTRIHNLFIEIQMLCGLQFDETKLDNDYLAGCRVLLLNYCTDKGITFVYGKGTRKTPEQRLYDNLVKYAMTYKECKEKIQICGNRNSYSKTDHDATMMHMKYDYYMNTGVFKAGYNIQMGVSDGFIREVYVSADRNDSKTLPPFIRQYQKRYNNLPGIVVADAGYGSYDNYMFCLENGIDGYLKYNTYRIEQTKADNKKQFINRNLLHKENGKLLCPKNREFIYEKDVYSNKGEYLQIKQIYKCKTCKRCPFHKQCTKGETRTISIDVVSEELKKNAREKLKSAAGKQLLQQRSIQAEGTFGILKQDREYVRIHRRGQQNVENEIYLVSIGHNLMKYHTYKRSKIMS